MPSADAAFALRCRAGRGQAALAAQDAAWAGGSWTRRSFLAGLGMVGVAALGSQLVTSRASYATGPTAGTTNTLVVVFLRGAADGLRILVPNSSALGLDYLTTVRNDLLPANPLPLSNGWALNPAMAPLASTLWQTGELAFVPAMSDAGITRSHFQAQQFLEAGGVIGAPDGWLDRVLAQVGPGTTFRAVSIGDTEPASCAGSEKKLAMPSLADFTFPGWSGWVASAETATGLLYRGMTGPLGEDVPDALAALDTAATIRAGAGPQNGASYPDGSFSDALRDLADTLRAEVGLQVATVDVGGWDTHTDEANQLDGLLGSAAGSLAAFMTDLGPERRKRVTVVVMTEFGRRVEMNASNGTDHGHGSVAWLLGGGLTRSDVFGSWTKLTAASLDQGDVPGLNDPFDVMGELAQKRLGVGTLSSVFPGHTYRPLGLATTV
ncbi:DUF1501 domain-containing protein [Jatrophihabitans sp.]|uniref:DUF1501 domain-containing protein n=1 Tax=Jatrophihabitans sp. TaxID=1932789 RepID=UPI0030C70439|nr:hypothetical protein [Jatrophihabitans sp.]